MNQDIENFENELKSQIEKSISSHCYSTAIFFADKLITLFPISSKKYIENLFILCNALYCDRQYQRSTYLILKYLSYQQNHQSALKSSPLDGKATTVSATTNWLVSDETCPLLLKLKIIYLAGKCKIELAEWNQCLDIIGVDNDNLCREKSDGGRTDYSSLESEARNMLSNICQIRGKCYESLESFKKSSYWYVQSLILNHRNFESFDALMKNHLLNHSEEIELLSQLKFTESEQWLRDLYSTSLKKYDIVSDNGKLTKENKVPNVLSLCKNINSSGSWYQIIFNSNDVQTSLAEYYFYHHQYRAAYNITSKILKEDRYYNNGMCLKVHLSSMFELGLTNELYLNCHQLVDTAQQPGISWYGVACYYHLIGNSDLTQRFFTKATTIDSRNGASWLGFGHFFAEKGEHDQAMAAYRTSARMLTGCHLPPLCIGMELIRVHNLNLASQYILQARDICPYDPLVYNELGIIEYKNQRYENAILYFEKSLYICSKNGSKNNNNNSKKITTTNSDNTIISIDSETWEPTAYNLAHCFRKLRKFDKALQYYQLSHSLSPNDASIYSAIGYTHHLQGNFDNAIDYYHQSLSIRDDSFTNTLLHKALSLSFLNYD